MKKIIMMGATGAVGTETVKALLETKQVEQLTLLGRRKLENIKADYLVQEQIDVFDALSYQLYINGHNVAICTLGVGEPTKVSKEEFIKLDKTAVLDFAKACKKAGVQHFELLASVGINANSRFYYLKTKGELVEELKALNFERLSIFQPSMILTPKNRYGFSQAITLKLWPLLRPLLLGSWKKYRGIPVAVLGSAIAKNVFTPTTTHYEELQWEEFYLIAN